MILVGPSIVARLGIKQPSEDRVAMGGWGKKLDAALEMTHTTEQQWQAFVKASKK